MALLLPISATVASSTGLNPLVIGLVVTTAVDTVILYPVQTAANLMAYESRYFDHMDVAKMGFGMPALTILVVLFTLPYWVLLGMPLDTPEQANPPLRTALQ